MFEMMALLAHALWIGGLSLLLSTFSYQSWQKSVPSSNFLAPSPFLARIGLLLSSLGFLILSSSWPLRVGWGGLLLLLAWLLLQRGPNRL